MENPYCKWNVKNWIDANDVSDEQISEIFPGMSSEACTNLPGKLAMSGNYDQVTNDNNILSYITENGYPCWYYPYLFQEEKMEEFTGEHSAAGYGRPFQIIILLKVEDKPSWVSNLGIENDETVTAWIHIKMFKKKIKPIITNNNDSRYFDYNSIYCLTPWEHDAQMKKIQPKPKDCFQLLTSSCDREWERGARIWEITNVEDEIFSEKFNMAQGHYVWKITAKRYRYSFEYGMSKLDEKSKDNPLLGQEGEIGNHQVYENEVVKMYLAANKIVTEDILHEVVAEDNEDLFMENDKENEIKEVHYKKDYSQDEVCEDAKKEVFDMEENVKGTYKHLDSGGFF